jgi:hypothetical protein
VPKAPASWRNRIDGAAVDGLDRRSSSAIAKYAEALRRISFAGRSSRTSRSKALIRSRSSLVGPARTPWSRSAWRTQPRSVSAVHPIFAAIEPIAAHSEACSPRCSNTIRTARARTSGEYLVCLLTAPSSQGLEPPANPGPGRFKLWGDPRFAAMKARIGFPPRG